MVGYFAEFVVWIMMFEVGVCMLLELVTVGFGVV